MAFHEAFGMKRTLEGSHGSTLGTVERTPCWSASSSRVTVWDEKGVVWCPALTCASLTPPPATVRLHIDLPSGYNGVSGDR